MNKQLTILLIDDDEDDRDFFQFALENISPEIEYQAASSGEEGLQVLKKSKVLPDYIFLDLNMPQMNGRECLAELKKDTILRRIPVVIFSTSNDPRDIEETKKLGAFDFITKPSKTTDLTNILNNFIINQLHYTLK